MNRPTWILKTAAITTFAMAALATAISLPARSQATVVFEEALEVFKTKCAVCHAADGSGSTPMGQTLKVRDLRSAEVQKQTDAQLSGTISKGKGKMPSYGKSLSSDLIKQLVAHIRTLKK
jgi:cytochrome c6